MKKIKILFVCIHNSARSQMAEAFINRKYSDNFESESAGIEPGELNPIVVQAMKERDIDISGNIPQSVHDKLSTSYNYVITVCDETNAERCPLFPGRGERLHWGFPDPSALTGTDEEKLEGTRNIRDEIEEKIDEFVKSVDFE